MVTLMNFLELKEEFEHKLKEYYKLELLDFYYSPYSFGSGMAAYRIKGRVIKVVYDGKDNEVKLLLSKLHDKYPHASWNTIYIESPSHLIENGIIKLNDLLNQL